MRILLEWVNDEVGLTQRVDDFCDLANGYLLGELLYRFNQQPDFGEFRDCDRVQNKIDNFCRLEPALCRLGIKGFDSLMALNIMNRDRKSCIDLLYKMKMALGSITMTVGRHPAADVMPGAFAALNNFHRLMRPAYDEQKSSIFRKSISIRLESQNQVDMHKHLQPFYDEAKRQGQYVEEMKRKDREDQEMYVQEIRVRRAMNRRAELEYFNDWHEKGIGIWVENQRRRRYVLDVYRRHESGKIETSQARTARQLEDARVDALEGILDMDRRVGDLEEKYQAIRDARKLQVEERTKSQQSTLDAEADIKAHGDEEQAPDDEETMFLMNRTESSSAILPLSKKDDTVNQIMVKRGAEIPGRSQKEANKYIKSLRLRNGSEPVAQGVRERRRVKFMVGLQEQTVTQLDDRNVQDMQQHISRPCEQEKQLEEQVMWARRYAKVAAKNRAFREIQVQEETKREATKSAYREAKLQEERERQADERAVWLRTHVNRIQSSREAARSQQVHEMCQDIVKNVVDISMSQVDHHILAGGSTFALRESLSEAVSGKPGNDECNAELMDSIELDNYLKWLRSWSPSGAGANDLVSKLDQVPPLAPGSFLMRARMVAKPEPQVLGPLAQGLKRFPLQIAILGAPFSGKSTAAWRLAARFNLRVINPQQALVAFFESRPELSQECRKEISDQTCVDAIVHTLRHLKERSESQQERVKALLQEVNDEGEQTSCDDAIEERLFALWDIDASGDIDPQEMLCATLAAHCEGKPREQVEAEAIEAFNQMDFDLNGRISRDEFRTYFEKVFASGKRSAMRELLQQTDELCRPLQGWILDNFPTSREQARLLELALSGIDIDKPRYQPETVKTLPCEPPEMPDRSNFTSLEKGALDVVLSLAMDESEVCLRAAKSDLKGTARFRIAPAILHDQSTRDQVRDWFDAFGTLHNIDDAGTLDQAAIFERIKEPVASMLECKLTRDNDAKRAQEAREFQIRCDNIVGEWAADLEKQQPSPQSNDEEQKEGETVDPSQALADQCVVPVPPLCAHTLIAAGVCDAQPDPGNGPSETHGTCWFSDKLCGSPEDAAARARAYRESQEGVLLGVAHSLVAMLTAHQVEFEDSSFKSAILDQLSIPQDHDHIEQGAEPADGIDADSAAQTSDVEGEKKDNYEESSNAIQFKRAAAFASFFASCMSRLVAATKEQVECEADREATGVEAGTADTAQGEEQRQETEDNEASGEEDCTVSPKTQAQPLIEAVRSSALELFIEKRKEQEELEKKAKKGGGKQSENTPPVTDRQATGADQVSSLLSERKVDPELASKIVELSDQADEEFTQGATETFRQLRFLRNAWLQHHAKVRAKFDMDLRSEESDAQKVALVGSFQQGFDQVDQDMRYHPRTKAELHERTEELARNLWEQIQDRKDEFTERIKETAESPWVGDLQELVSDQYLHLFQLETSRYQSVRGALILLGNELQGEAHGFTSTEQAELYSSLWPVASFYGESLNPDIIFPASARGETCTDDQDKGGKKNAKKAEVAADECSAENTAPYSDPRIAAALSAALSLAERLSGTDCFPLESECEFEEEKRTEKTSPAQLPEHLTQLQQALKSLDDQFQAAVHRLAVKAKETGESYDNIAAECWSRLEKNRDERVAAEILAVEALVLHVSSHIEDASSLEDDVLLLQGASFRLAAPKRLKAAESSVDSEHINSS